MTILLTEPNTDYLSLLPDELRIEIFSYLKSASLRKIAQVSKDWQRISNDNLLWKAILLRSSVNIHIGIAISNTILNKAPTNTDYKHAYLICSILEERWIGSDILLFVCNKLSIDKELQGRYINYKQSLLNFCNETDTNFEFLDKTPNIYYLDLSETNLLLSGVEDLAGTLKYSSCTLTALNFYNCKIGDKGSITLADALKINKTIASLNLRDNEIGDEGAIALAGALQINNTISSLDLSKNKISDNGAIAFAETLKANGNITSLALGWNQIGKEGTIALSESLKINKNISSLDLTASDLFLDGAIALGDALKINQSITSLVLFHSCICDKGAIALFKAFKINKTITSLDLSNNHIVMKDAIALAEAFKINKNISSLDLSGNKIRNEGATALAEALKINKSITSLNLSDNQIDNEGATALAEALKINKSIISLKLIYNWIGKQGTIALAEALKINKTITYLDLTRNWIGKEGTIALAETVVHVRRTQNRDLVIKTNMINIDSQNYNFDYFLQQAEEAFDNNSKNISGPGFFDRASSQHVESNFQPEQQSSHNNIWP